MFQSNLEPSANNIMSYMDNLWTKFQPREQCRWNQANINAMFYAGNQTFVNSQFNFTPKSSFGQYYFNLVQQPVNMITGYQRQHRKSITYIPVDGSDPNTTDQYTRLIGNCVGKNGIHEIFSKSCELSAVSGMNLMQPYLDFTGDDQAQGELKVKIWEYNSFLVDPYYRNADMSDAQFVWCQEYIAKNEAEARFPGQVSRIQPMQSNPQQYGRFYFLPEMQDTAHNDLMVLSYIWYKWHKKKKRLYSRSRNQFFDFAGGDGNMDMILQHIDDMVAVTVDVPCWKLCCVLNDRVVYQGNNPLGFDGCPFISTFWNYEPHLSDSNLRDRSLITVMRDPQFLFNYKVINNNDMVSAVINSGYKRMSGAVANEDNLKKTQAGWDIVINEGYQMSDVEKIIPSAVPESDLALAQQMADLIYNTSGINMENWSGQNDKQISSLTMMLKSAANLMVFQKYFDQWDHSFKLLGERMLSLVLNNWNASKVKMIINEDPTPYFYSKIFAKYNTIVEEGLLTPTQRNLHAQNLLDINTTFGREVIPPSMIIKDMNIQGKTEILEFLKKQEEQAASLQQEQTAVAHAFEDAKLKELYSRATLNIASAKERIGRSDSNLGLYEERISEIAENHSISTKNKIEALSKLVETIAMYGNKAAESGINVVKAIDFDETLSGDHEKQDSQLKSESNKFLEKVMGDMQQKNSPQGQQQSGQMPTQQEV